MELYGHNQQDQILYNKIWFTITHLLISKYTKSHYIKLVRSNTEVIYHL